MNVIEKILGQSWRATKRVRPGDVVVANVDPHGDARPKLQLRHESLRKRNGERHDQGPLPHRLRLRPQLRPLPVTQQAAEALAAVRKFAAKHGIRHVLDCGCGSVHHAIIESGLWKPGQVIIGCDSHTPIYGALGVFATGVGNNSMAALGFQYSLRMRGSASLETGHPGLLFHGETGPVVTPRDISQYLIGRIGEDGAVYKAIEYAGPYMQALPVEDRMLFPLMSIDVGAKCGFINPDEKTVAFARRSFCCIQRTSKCRVNDPGVSHTKKFST